MLLQTHGGRAVQVCRLIFDITQQFASRIFVCLLYSCNRQSFWREDHILHNGPVCVRTAHRFLFMQCALLCCKHGFSLPLDHSQATVSRVLGARFLNCIPLSSGVPYGFTKNSANTA